jgi:UDP-N-acetylglucosamine acyltransferase
MAAIDPTARVADGARLGEDVEIGPYCLIGPDVELGHGVRLIANVRIAGATNIGEGTVVYPFTSLGSPPQSVHYRGGATRLIVGPRCELRESVTINTGTEDGGGVTRVGERCFFMVGCHIGHDCQVGNAATFANNVVLGGHVSVGDNTFVGGLTAVHQHNRIGEGAMIGGMTRVRADVIPFGFAYLENLVGLNVVGLRRRGSTRADLHRLRRAYHELFFGDGVFAKRIDAVSSEFAGDPLVEKIVAFIRAGSARRLMQPVAERSSAGNGEDAA